jgi:hypothetical protein
MSMSGASTEAATVAATDVQPVLRIPELFAAPYFGTSTRHRLLLQRTCVSRLVSVPPWTCCGARRVLFGCVRVLTPSPAEI